MHKAEVKCEIFLPKTVMLQPGLVVEIDKCMELFLVFYKYVNILMREECTQVINTCFTFI